MLYSVPPFEQGQRPCRVEPPGTGRPPGIPEIHEAHPGITGKSGIKAGVLKPRVFRPFPVYEIAEALKNVKAVAVMDKADSLNGAGGPLFEDVTSAMFIAGVTSPKVVNYIYGIGGRDVKTTDIEKVYNDLRYIIDTGDIGTPYRYLGLKG